MQDLKVSISNYHEFEKFKKCKSENLQISLSSHKNNMLKISHYNSIYFWSYSHSRYMECWYTNILKQYNMLESSLLFKKNTNFTGKYLENS